MLPKRIGRKIIYESDWICLYADRVELPDGRMIEAYHKLRGFHAGAVVCHEFYLGKN